MIERFEQSPRGWNKLRLGVFRDRPLWAEVALQRVSRAKIQHPNAKLLTWARAERKDVLGDLAVLKSSPHIFYHRPGVEPVDITPEEIARLERRIQRLDRVIAAKSGGAG